MADQDRQVTVKFTPEALAEFGIAWPEAPPGDEIVLTVKLQPCEFCGEDIPEGEIGGIDPEGVTEEGELVGTFVCQSCMAEGL